MYYERKSICLSYVNYVVLTANEVSTVFGIGMCLVLYWYVLVYYMYFVFWYVFCPEINATKRFNS